jgi:hypothetical protein
MKPFFRKERLPCSMATRNLPLAYARPFFSLDRTARELNRGVSFPLSRTCQIVDETNMPNAKPAAKKEMGGTGYAINYSRKQKKQNDCLP